MAPGSLGPNPQIGRMCIIPRWTFHVPDLVVCGIPNHDSLAPNRLRCYGTPVLRLAHPNLKNTTISRYDSTNNRRILYWVANRVAKQYVHYASRVLTGNEWGRTTRNRGLYVVPDNNSPICRQSPVMLSHILCNIVVDMSQSVAIMLFHHQPESNTLLRPLPLHHFDLQTRHCARC